MLLKHWSPHRDKTAESAEQGVSTMSLRRLSPHRDSTTDLFCFVFYIRPIQCSSHLCCSRAERMYGMTPHHPLSMFCATQWGVF